MVVTQLWPVNVILLYALATILTPGRNCVVTIIYRSPIAYIDKQGFLLTREAWRKAGLLFGDNFLKFF